MNETVMAVQITFIAKNAIRFVYFCCSFVHIRAYCRVLYDRKWEAGKTTALPGEIPRFSGTLGTKFRADVRCNKNDILFHSAVDFIQCGRKTQICMFEIDYFQVLQSAADSMHGARKKRTYRRRLFVSFFCTT